MRYSRGLCYLSFSLPLTLFSILFFCAIFGFVSMFCSFVFIRWFWISQCLFNYMPYLGIRILLVRKINCDCFFLFLFVSVSFTVASLMNRHRRRYDQRRLMSSNWKRIERAINSTTNNCPPMRLRLLCYKFRTLHSVHSGHVASNRVR